MIDKKKVIRAVYNAIDEINLQVPVNKRIKKAAETILFAPSYSLDSLMILNLIVTTEQQIENEFGIMILLTGDELLNKDTTPLSSIETLTNHIYRLLQVKSNE